MNNNHLRVFGSTKKSVSEVGQGTWRCEVDSVASIRAIQRGIDLGLTHIDTAEMYGDGEVERIVGKAIEGKRSELFLVSKVLPSHASFDGTIKACERTLAHLKTDYLDTYLLHWKGANPLTETFRAFEHLVKQGKIRAFGVSNFDVTDLQEAVVLVAPEKIACNQVLYHLNERSIEFALRPWCEKKGIALVAYSPFGQDHFPPSHSRGGQILAEIGKRHGKTARQVALAFLLRNLGTFVIPKSAQPSHVEENAGAMGLRLGVKDLIALDGAFPAVRKASLPTL